MLGNSANSFGQGVSSSNPFGNTSNLAANPFAAKPFGAAASSPFSTQTGSSIFGSTATGAPQTSSPFSSSPAFGSSSPAFGASSSTTTTFGSSAPAFGASSEFGQKPSFGGFGSNPQTNLFGSSSQATPSSTGFGSSTIAPSFGTPSVSAFGASSSQAFGVSGTSTFNFSSTPAFGQSGSAFGTSTFGQQQLGGSRGGTRISSYTSSSEADGTGQSGKLISIAVMPVYKDKSHEELRWEDYQLGDKGGPAAPGQSPPSLNTSPATSSLNPFTLPSSSNPFSTSSSSLSPSTTSAFSANPIFGSGSIFSAASTPSLFSSSASAQTASLFSSTPFNTSPSLFSTPSSSLPPQNGSLFTQNTSSSNIFNISTSMPSFQTQTALLASFTGSLVHQAMPQMSSPIVSTVPNVQYGISTMPVPEKPAPILISSMLTSRHLSRGRITLPVRKYHPSNDTQKVPFFDDNNPKPTISMLENNSSDHESDIEALLPKLKSKDYYTEPHLQEMAAKEREKPGFCRRVNDFVVGRHGYGSIKFIGETDIRRLDLESLVQFNDREVIVYMEEDKKPPVGHGLNKPAVVTLLNVTCLDRKTGCPYKDGPKVQKFKEILKKKAHEQDAEFISYHPETGEWKFKVNHFSKYLFCVDKSNF